MKFVNGEYGLEFNYEDQNVISLVCENKRTFGEILESINDLYYGRGDSQWVLSEKNRIIDFKKYGEFILNPFIENLNVKKLEKGLYGYFQKNLDDEILRLLMKVNNVSDEIFARISGNLMININWSQNMDIIALSKAAAVSVEFDGRNWIENLLDYVKLSVDLCGTVFFIFVNLDIYMSVDDLSLFNKELESYGVKILHVWSRESDLSKRSKTVLLDEDNCVIEC